MLCKKIRQYLIDFLVGSLWVQSEGDDRFQRRFEAIGYTDDPEQMKLYPIVIIPSGFFKMDVYGTEESMPTLPLKTWRGIPLLFGEPREEWSADGSQLIIHADLLASTYFLISRYEEMYRRSERDSYGRFPGKSSLPYRAGFLHRPIIDEYGEALRRASLSATTYASRSVPRPSAESTSPTTSPARTTIVAGEASCVHGSSRRRVP